MITTKKSDFEGRYVRTDLACESGSISPEEIKGALYERIENGGITTERLHVLNEEGEIETGKKKGRYITVSGSGIKRDLGKDEDLTAIISNEIKKLCKAALEGEIGRSTKVLIAGIGNRMITSDALGPMTADNISPTRHIASFGQFSTFPFSQVSIIKTAVMGQTGIESSEILKAVAEKTRPDIILTVDALAARSVSRLASTIQLSDTGISPGSGIGNTRDDINKDTMGVPVISIGVPTVVNSSTLIYDALDKAGIDDISHSLVEVLDNSKSFFVSPKECDFVNIRLSRILSEAISDVFGCRGL